MLRTSLSASCTLVTMLAGDGSDIARVFTVIVVIAMHNATDTPLITRQAGGHHKEI
ncbi:MAG: hypothetical protein ACK4VP_05030 [Nitrospira sp.]